MTSVHGARPFIYKGLHRALKIVAKNFLRYLTSNTWRRFIFFSTFEPKICKSAILSAVSMSTLKILSRGYNMATRKKFETYKMLRYKELQSLVHKSLSPQTRV